jgi:hypothetical protein
MLVFLAQLVAVVNPCVTVEDVPSSSTTGGHFTFAARVPNWQAGARVRVRVALPHTDGERAADCDAACASEDEVGFSCRWCKCAACPICPIGGNQNQAIGEGCLAAGQIISCSSARTVAREAFGATVLRLGDPSLTHDRRFGCTVTAPPGAKHATPTFECVDMLPGPPAPPTAPSPPEPTPIWPTAPPPTPAAPPPRPRPPRLLENLPPRSTPTVRVAAASAATGAGKHDMAPPAPSSSPALSKAVPAWIQWQSECTHLLRSPNVEASSSASFRISPAVSAPPVPRCELGLRIRAEYKRGEEGAWHHVVVRQSGAVWHADNVRCGVTAQSRCSFRVRPVCVCGSNSVTHETALLV